MSLTQTLSRGPQHTSPHSKVATFSQSGDRHNAGKTDDMMRDIAFVLHLTRRVADSIARNTKEATLPNVPATVPC